MTRSVVVAPALPALVADRLLAALAGAQAARGSASVALTGGGTGIEVLHEVRRSPAAGSVDWRRVDVWWGDERWLPAGDPERNDAQARAALLDHLDLDPDRVHPVSAVGGPDADVDEAAARYASALASAPPFDVLLLGMGAEGHTASIFPDSPAAHDERLAVGVRDCPKPPPERVSLGFRALTSAREVWVCVAGADKAPAVARALSGADRVTLPAAGAVGSERTLWLVDEVLAAALPPELRET